MVVGTAHHMTLSPRTCSGGSLILFKLTPDGAKLEHVHTVSGYRVERIVCSGFMFSNSWGSFGLHSMCV